jgi:T5SS/PEP-CTERM-associated repeat protein
MKRVLFAILVIAVLFLFPPIVYSTDWKIGDHVTQTVIVDGTPAHPSVPFGQYTSVQAGLNGGQGTLQIKDGGTVSVSDSGGISAFLGMHEGSHGTLQVSGSGSAFHGTQHIHVGYSGGTGEILVENQGCITSNIGYICSYGSSEGSAIIRDRGSSWDVSRRFDVGCSPTGHGTLSIENGGRVTTGYTIVAIGGSTASGSIVVSGAGSRLEAIGFSGAGTLDNGSLRVGYGTGTLEVKNGGAVVSKRADIAVISSGKGTVTIGSDSSSDARATWSNTGAVHVGGWDLDTREEEGGLGLLDIRSRGDVTIGDRLKIWGPGRVNVADGGTLITDAIEMVEGAEFGFQLGYSGSYIYADEISLNGSLLVELSNGFELEYNQTRYLAHIGHTLNGHFQGLAEDGLVGNFGGKNLYISYFGGDGNDIVLYTSVPEPGTFVYCLIGLVVGTCFWCRRFFNPLFRS